MSSKSVLKGDNEIFCNNCGKQGHYFNICKLPITSLGVIVFRMVNNKYEYLMIRRKDTLGFIDFNRGKFIVTQKKCIMNMLIQMTSLEKESLLLKYDQVKQGNVSGVKDRIIELIQGVYKNNTFYDLKSLIHESNTIYNWTHPEWGFPKGRRNVNECDFDCAVREFTEETGYPSSILRNVNNIVPFEETFIGSNYNSYRHKYFLMFMSFADSIKAHTFQKSEVSCIDWFPFEKCIEIIRPYNLEKKKIIENVDSCLNHLTLFSFK